LETKLESESFNTFTSGLIQAVRAKTAGLHMAFRGNFSNAVSATDQVKSSKDSASLVLCARKIFGFIIIINGLNVVIKLTFFVNVPLFST